MPGRIRETSSTGVYHVMLRGNNKQVIFEGRKDYLKFQNFLFQKCHPQDSDHNPLVPCCVIYAYCLMPNHVHLLIQEKEEKISDVIKWITISYAQYYNIKYGHSGHLFQGRFRSENVEDWDYFVTLLRYICKLSLLFIIVNSPSSYTTSYLCCPVLICPSNFIVKSKIIKY